jgi:uncharacterized protein
MIQSMKKIIGAAFILCLFAALAFAELQLPSPQGMVNDFAGKLAPNTNQQLENLLKNFRDRSGIEITVVTVNFDDMQGYPIEDYALYLGRQWGVGRDSQKRALVLVVAIKPPGSDGLYHGGTRLEVSRHLEGDLPDGLAGEIIRKMRDYFPKGQFDQALTLGTQTIVATLAQKLGISMEGIDANQAYRAPAPQPRSRSSRGLSPFMIIVIVFIFLAIVHAFSNRRGGGGGGGGGRRGGSGMEWLIWGAILGSGRGGSNWGGSSSDSGWGGGGGSSDGGGFGGFGGGGDFGGGGASDSW